MILHRMNSDTYEQREFVFKNTKRVFRGIKNLFNLRRTVKHIKKKSANDRAVELTKALNKSFKEEKSIPKGNFINNLRNSIPNGTGAVAASLAVAGGLGIGSKKYLDRMDKVDNSSNEKKV